MSHICLSFFGIERWPEEGLFPIGLHEDGNHIQGTMREESLDFLTIGLLGSKLHQDLKVPFTVLQPKFHFEYHTKKGVFGHPVAELKPFEERHLPRGQA